MSLANAQLQEFISWKCANEVSREDLERRAGVKAEEATDYERALRYNLSDHERTAMVELLWAQVGASAGTSCDTPSSPFVAAFLCNYVYGLRGTDDHYQNSRWID